MKILYQNTSNFSDYEDWTKSWNNPQTDKQLQSWFKRNKLSTSLPAFKQALASTVLKFMTKHPDFEGDADLRGAGHMSRRILRGGYCIVHSMVHYIQVDGNVIDFSEHDMLATEWIQMLADELKVPIEQISREV